jgi:REP element-mobilizing transposase RayT
MTAPRQVLPGVTYLVTRRCARREFLLRPGKVTNQTFLFLLALAARRFSIQVHAFCVLSNHFHLVLTDPKAQLPAFHQLLDALVARAQNAFLGRFESFWAPSSYSAVALSAPEDIVDKTAYVLANPVAAGLVRSGRLWPGLWSAPEQLGNGSLEAARPAHFFDKKGSLPETLTLELTVPPGFASAEAFRAQVVAALAAKEKQAARDVGGEFLGVARVLRQKPTGRAVSQEPRRGLRPRLAALDKWKRIEALGRLKEFLDAYRVAWAAWRAGDDAALFPSGTYLMRVLHRAPCVGFG